jgi:hypothetical protein
MDHLIATLPVYTSRPLDWPRIRAGPLSIRYRSKGGVAPNASVVDYKFESEMPAFLADTTIWGKSANFAFAADLS